MPRLVQKYLQHTPVVRMSSNPHNLFALQSHSIEIAGKNSFKQRWLAKREILSYFGGTIRTKQFKKIFATEPIPAPTIKEKNADLDNHMQLSLAFSMMERRLDVILYRSLLVSSVFEARSKIKRGFVSVNSVICRNFTKLVHIGDVVQFEAKNNDNLFQIPEVSKKTAIPDVSEQIADSCSSRCISKLPLPRSVLRNGVKVNSEYYFQPRIFFLPWLFVPNYLEVSFNTGAVVMHRLPNVKLISISGSRDESKRLCSDIPSPFNSKIMALAYEWFIRRCKRQHLKRRYKSLKSLYNL
eukprot:NODE_659_length_4968_cov_0.490655.p3 type:complete len:297 gc:universal NODE_659_length_4968_cov_0.490655:2562-3452(+)